MTSSNSSSTGSSGSFIDPKTLMSIRNLELRARAVVEGFWSGIHRSPYHGFSVEFTEYRQYTPGDDPRFLDWRVYGKSDRYFIKKFEDETNLRCHLVVDQSRSMNFGSLKFTKAQFAATLAATFGWFLHQQGDAIGLITFDGAVRDHLPARHRLSHLRQVIYALEKPASGGGTDIVAPIEHASVLIRKRGMLVMISDFLAPLDRLERALATVIAGGHEVVVFQVLDPAELTFNFEPAVLFEDIESGEKLFIDPAAARAGYLQRMEAHCAALKRLCEKLGIGCRRLSTDQPLEHALFAFLQERKRSDRRAPRVHQRTGGGGS